MRVLSNPMASRNFLLPSSERSSFFRTWEDTGMKKQKQGAWFSIRWAITGKNNVKAKTTLSVDPRRTCEHWSQPADTGPLQLSGSRPLFPATPVLDCSGSAWCVDGGCDLGIIFNPWPFFLSDPFNNLLLAGPLSVPILDTFMATNRSMEHVYASAHLFHSEHCNTRSKLLYCKASCTSTILTNSIDTHCATGVHIPHAHANVLWLRAFAASVITPARKVARRKSTVFEVFEAMFWRGKRGIMKLSWDSECILHFL